MEDPKAGSAIKHRDVSHNPAVTRPDGEAIVGSRETETADSPPRIDAAPSIFHLRFRHPRSRLTISLMPPRKRHHSRPLAGIFVNAVVLRGMSHTRFVCGSSQVGARRTRLYVLYTLRGRALACRSRSGVPQGRRRRRKAIEWKRRDTIWTRKRHDYAQTRVTLGTKRKPYHEWPRTNPVPRMRMHAFRRKETGAHRE